MTDKPIIFSGPMVRAILKGRKTQTRRVMPDQTLINASGQIWTGFMGWQSIEWALQNRGACGRGVMPNFSIGDRLWVREAWVETHPVAFQEGRKGLRLLHAGIPGPPPVNYLVAYRADGELRPYWHSTDYPYRALEPRDEDERKIWPNGCEAGWNSPIHMPRKASRLTLIVEDVRVQRLQEISAKDSIAEGADCETCKAMRRSACSGQGCFASIGAFRDLWDSLNAKRGYGWDANPWVVAITFRPIQKNIDALQSEAAE